MRSQNCDSSDAFTTHCPALLQDGGRAKRRFFSETEQAAPLKACPKKLSRVDASDECAEGGCPRDVFRDRRWAESGQNGKRRVGKKLVDGRRLELPTSALRTRRSPN